MSRVPLEQGEQVLVEGREAPALQWFRYTVTLGLYEFWRRAKVVRVTNRRLIICAGIVTKSDRSLPMSKIQDVTIRTQIGFGRLVVTTAGGAAGTIDTPWMSADIARKMRDALNSMTSAAPMPPQAHTPAPAAGPPPGWYQTPQDAPGTLRWWDGVRYTEHTQTGLPQPPA